MSQAEDEFNAVIASHDSADRAEPIQLAPSADGDAQVMRFFGDSASAAIHNFVGTPLDVLRLTSIATGPACKKHGDMPADGIEVVNLYCHKVELTGKDGEVSENIRTVLIDKDGNAYGCVSAGVAQDASNIFKVMGYGKWPQPIKLKIVESKTNSNRRMLGIQFV